MGPHVHRGSHLRLASAQHTYDVKKKSGEAACPFNYLYGHFLQRNRAKLGGNRRLSFPYKTLSRFSDDKINTIIADAEAFLEYEFGAR